METKQQDTKKPKSQHEIKEDVKKNTLRQMTTKTLWNAAKVILR